MRVEGSKSPQDAGRQKTDRAIVTNHQGLDATHTSGTHRSRNSRVAAVKLDSQVRCWGAYGPPTDSASSGSKSRAVGLDLLVRRWRAYGPPHGQHGPAQQRGSGAQGQGGKGDKSSRSATKEQRGSGARGQGSRSGTKEHGVSILSPLPIASPPNRI